MAFRVCSPRLESERHTRVPNKGGVRACVCLCACIGRQHVCAARAWASHTAKLRYAPWVHSESSGRLLRAFFA
jgi:hypothetical protein